MIQQSIRVLKTSSRSTVLMILSFVFLLGVIIYIAPSPLQGIHRIRQADTLFAAYSYCKERSPFHLPKISHRENTSGVAIGEFPLYSYIVSLKCKLTGSWDEITPKLLTWLMGLFAILFWFKNFQILLINKNGTSKSLEGEIGLLSFAFLFIFATQVHLHWMIPIPDILAVLIFGLSFYILFHEKRSPLFYKLLLVIASALLFAIAFVIRPYFLLLIFLPILKFVLEKPPSTSVQSFVIGFLQEYFYWFIATGIFSFGLYFYWYKINIYQTEIYYYNLSIVPFREVLADKLKIIEAFLIQIFRNHMNVIGVWLVWLALRKDKASRWIFAIALINAMFIITIKGSHIVNHGYYLGLTSLLVIFIMARGFGELSERRKVFFVSLYFIIFILNTQHLWNRQGLYNFHKMQALIEEQKVSADQKIVSYATHQLDDTGYLYWAKRTGWALPEAQFRAEDPCPWGADFYLFWASKPNDLQLKKCP